jgi:hypothetical protein
MLSIIVTPTTPITSSLPASGSVRRPWRLPRFCAKLQELIDEEEFPVKLRLLQIVAALATLAIACGGLATGGGTAGGAGGSGGTAGMGGGGSAGVGGGVDAGTSFDAAILDSALPESSDSPIETFEFIKGGVVQDPMSCPGIHWEYSGVVGESAPDVYIRNTGSVPLVYTAAPVWDVGIGDPYIPGLVDPTAPKPQDIGVLAPGASVNITSFYEGGYVALLGASKPFSLNDGGYAPWGEGTIAWPSGIPDSADAGTMYVAQIYVGSCGPDTELWN